MCVCARTPDAVYKHRWSTLWQNTEWLLDLIRRRSAISVTYSTSVKARRSQVQCECGENSETQVWLWDICQIQIVEPVVFQSQRRQKDGQVWDGVVVCECECDRPWKVLFCPRWWKTWFTIIRLSVPTCNALVSLNQRWLVWSEDNRRVQAKRLRSACFHLLQRGDSFGPFCVYVSDLKLRSELERKVLFTLQHTHIFDCTVQ